MLDETDNTTLKSGGNSTAGIPAPRRRRAASRPAGAPAPVETMGAPVAITAAEPRILTLAPVPTGGVGPLPD